jgi:hypothetical protein
MSSNDPAEILEALVAGDTPPMAKSTVVKALLFGARAIRELNGSRGMPARYGYPWDAEEDLKLIREVQNGQEIKTIADKHERTVGSILARMTALGLNPAQDELISAESVLDGSMARQGCDLVRQQLEQEDSLVAELIADLKQQQQQQQLQQLQQQQRQQRISMFRGLLEF